MSPGRTTSARSPKHLADGLLAERLQRPVALGRDLIGREVAQLRDGAALVVRDGEIGVHRDARDEAVEPGLAERLRRVALRRAADSRTCRSPRPSSARPARRDHPPGRRRGARRRDTSPGFVRPRLKNVSSWPCASAASARARPRNLGPPSRRSFTRARRDRRAAGRPRHRCCSGRSRREPRRPSSPRCRMVSTA